MEKVSTLKIAFILALLFLIAGVLTLTAYGVNWDTINHLPRGQAYLQYFLGSRDYANLPKFPKNSFQDPSTLKPRTTGRSFYQSDETTLDYFLKYGGDGHPPLSDELSSVFNRVLYGKLHIIDDIDAYHVYGIFVAACLIALIFYWVSKEYGRLAGFISAVSLSMYPLFWSESHFNTEKDVPETVFWSFFLFCIWNGFVKKSVKWILLSGIFFGLALGTKFNILFSILVIAPWVVIYFLRNKLKLISGVNIKIALAGVIAFLIGCTFLFVSFPNLWADPIVGIENVFKFYRRLGVAGAPFDPRFIVLGKINLYPITWIITTTPPVILFFAIVGILFAIINFRKEKKLTLLLFLLWFFMPIARVTWDAANIYGGIRQIMEYVPALSVLTGLGATFIVSRLKVLDKNNLLKIVFIFVFFGALLIPIVQTHPNENAYFNFLIGGLSGAKAKDMPSWGNTFGSAYRGAAKWINANVPQKADLDLVNELLPNLPTVWIRPDINFSALNRSGYLRKGEYALTLNYDGTNKRSYYDMYLDKFLNPVYQEKVDGVPVVSVWKNDNEHLKEPWVEKKVTNFAVSSDKKSINFDLKKEYKVSRLEIDYNEKNCLPLAMGVVSISGDGNNWQELPDKLPEFWTIAAIGEQPKNGHFIEPFIGDSVRFIKFDVSPADTCLLKNKTAVRLFYLE